MVSGTIDYCPLLVSNSIKNMLEDLRDQKVDVSLLQNSLYTDAPKTTAMIDFFASIEAEAKVSIKRNKTVIHL